jgi:hypothetical protein
MPFNIKRRNNSTAARDLGSQSPVFEIHFYDNKKPVSFHEAITYFIHADRDPSFPMYCASTLKEVASDINIDFMIGFPKLDNLSKNPNFVVYIRPEPRLNQMTADPSAFVDAIAKTGSESKEPWILIPNLGGDSGLLVPRVPKNRNEWSKFKNIGTFFRSGTVGEIVTFLKYAMVVIDDIMCFDAIRFKKSYITTESLYVNTQGLAIPWLHFRFDTTPKYVHWF